MPALPPPEDRTVTTLYIGNLPENVSEDELKGHFYQYGEIRYVFDNNISCRKHLSC